MRKKTYAMSFLMRKLQCFTSEALQIDPSESECRKCDIFNVFVQSLWNLQFVLRVRIRNSSTTNAVEILLVFVGGICWFGFTECLDMKRNKSINKTPGEQRDVFLPRTVLQLHKCEAQEQPTHHKNAKKFAWKNFDSFSYFLCKTQNLSFLR